MSGRILVHKRDSENWKLRKFRAKSENHPIDPNWETGSYRRCHEAARNRLSAGDWVFDVVKGPNEKATLRSAFQITKVQESPKGRKLFFDRYYFVGDNAMLLGKLHPTYHGDVVSDDELASVLDQIQLHKYHECLAGKKPPSLNFQDWISMCGAAQGASEAHNCQ